jgi:hypothetical protein
MTPRRLPRYWLSRLVIALEVLVAVVIVSWFEDASLTARSDRRNGPLRLDAGRRAVRVLRDRAGRCSVVNDVMPKRFVLPTALHLRTLGFMGMAILLGMLGVLVVSTHGYTPLMFVYWLNACACGGCFVLRPLRTYRP